MDKQSQKRAQELAASILSASGQDYDAWLYNQHMALVAQHAGLITKALNGLQKQPNHQAQSQQP